MMIGRYLMNKLGMIVELKKKNLICDSVIVPLWRDGANLHNTKLNRA